VRGGMACRILGYCPMVSNATTLRKRVDPLLRPAVRATGFSSFSPPPNTATNFSKTARSLQARFECGAPPVLGAAG
jgi:hypothetical protein